MSEFLEWNRFELNDAFEVDAFTCKQRRAAVHKRTLFDFLVKNEAQVQITCNQALWLAYSSQLVPSDATQWP